MTRVLVVWEDHHYETLGPFVKKRVSARAPAATARFPEILFHTSHGNGSFKRYVASTWENVRSKGLPGNPGLIDHLICVVDGDKLHERLDIVPHPPAEEAALPSWLAAAERAWQNHLRALCDKAPPGTVHGRVLRWAKESLVLAGYDREAVKLHLGIDLQSPAIREHLARCSPDPSTVDPSLFSSTFRKPLRCLTELDGAQRAPRPPSLSKNAPELDDALRALAREDSTLVAERAPDIDRIADLVWQLAAPGPSVAQPAGAPDKAPRGEKSSRRAERAPRKRTGR
jgi:hypothetical protein